MAKKWVVTMLMIAFVRMQFICCCGSFAICTPTISSPLSICTDACGDSCHPSSHHADASADDCHEHASCPDHESIHDHALVSDGSDVHVHDGGESAEKVMCTRPVESTANLACESCHECGRHHHHLYMVKHGFINSAGKVSCDSLVLVTSYACVSSKVFDLGKLDPRPHSRSTSSPLIGLGILESLGQLRI